MGMGRAHELTTRAKRRPWPATPTFRAGISQGKRRRTQRDQPCDANRQPAPDIRRDGLTVER